MLCDAVAWQSRYGRLMAWEMRSLQSKQNRFAFRALDNGIAS